MVGSSEQNGTQLISPDQPALARLMGITIGEIEAYKGHKVKVERLDAAWKLDKWASAKPGELSKYYQIKIKSLPDAPLFDGDELTKRSNYRVPSPKTWFIFCRLTGLSTLFFDEQTGLMRAHPGIVPLTRSHEHMIKIATGLWRVNHPHVAPGWLPAQDAVLARLIWLEFWVAWAVTNCKRPGIQTGTRERRGNNDV